MEGKCVHEGAQTLTPELDGKRPSRKKTRKDPVDDAAVSPISVSFPQEPSFSEQGEKQTFLSLRCREVMSGNPTYCLPSDPVDVAARLMVAHNVGSLPVVQSAQTTKIIGLVSDRDLTVRVVAEGRDPKGTIIEEVMTPEPVTCHPEDDARWVLERMVEHQLRRLPVVDDNGFLIGAIAQADITLRVAAAEKTAGDGIPPVLLQSEQLTGARQ